MPRSSTRTNKATSVNTSKPLFYKPPPPAKCEKQNPNGFIETMKQGFAFGTGSAVSRIFVDSLFGMNSVNQKVQQPNSTFINTEEIQKKYLECMNNASNPEQSEKCETYKKQLYA